MKKSITILTGPQGSGNHLFSKILGLHPKIKGWNALYNKLWSGHYEEPYVDIWFDVANIEKIDWTGNYHIISISCPAFIRGSMIFPNYKLVIDALENKGFDVQIAIIGRDINIIRYQQTRVRKRETVDIFLEHMPYLSTKNPVFLSQELLYMYEINYVNQVYKQLKLPIVNEFVLKKYLLTILQCNTNAKYIKNVTEIQDLDKEVWKAGRRSRGKPDDEPGC